MVFRWLGVLFLLASLSHLFHLRLLLSLSVSMEDGVLPFLILVFLSFCGFLIYGPG